MSMSHLSDKQIEAAVDEFEDARNIIAQGKKQMRDTLEKYAVRYIDLWTIINGEKYQRKIRLMRRHECQSNQ